MTHQTKSDLIVLGIILTIIFSIAYVLLNISTKKHYHSWLDAIQNDMYRYYDACYNEASIKPNSQKNEVIEFKLSSIMNEFKNKEDYREDYLALKSSRKLSDMFFPTNEIIKNDEVLFAVRIRNKMFLGIYPEKFLGIYANRTIKEINNVNGMASLEKFNKK